MQSLSSHLRMPVNIKAARNQREDLMQQFLLRLNPGRIAMKLPPLTPARFNKEVAFMSDLKSLYFLWSVCDKSPNFSKAFWVEVKRSQGNYDLPKIK